MDFQSRYGKLNDRQKQTVDTIDGPLMVIAGPGTGKTELLSMRAANILQRTDTLPENILCLTFTESGAAAMRQRMAEIIGPDAYKVAIHTFHSFGSEVINRYGEYFYHGADFRPASDLSAYELLRSIFDSLDFSNPLSGKMNDDYTHLSDTLTTISELKKSGLTNEELLQLLDANDAVLDTAEPDLQTAFASRISAKTAASLSPVATKLAELEPLTMPPEISPLSSVLALSLAHAIDSAADQQSTKPITAWKNAHLEKNEEGMFVFKNRKRSRKLRAVSYLYYQYLMKMQEEELYDFDDMVLRVVHAMEVFSDLRYNLQEKYLYVMVDEFQDTNLAQARILHNLTTTETGDAPNIMVVGDDDQAIYSFQGAEVGNILGFRDRYEAVKIVTLTDNYRSADIILQKARSIITQGGNRLEQYIDEVDKTLTAHRTPKQANVSLTKHSRIEDERRAVALAIRMKIDAGFEPSNIAVLARRHHELVALLPYLSEQNIAVNYERRDNVLESQVIVQLVRLSRIVCYLAAGDISDADALLPELLAHPAWGYDTESLWKLSLNAHKHHGSWLEQMAVTPEFKPLFDWLNELIRLSTTEPTERLIDIMVGNPDEDQADGTFHSPLYPYFFADSTKHSDPEAYVVYLESLRTVRSKLQQYRPNEPLSLDGFIDFVELHARLGSSIANVRIRSNANSGAINLMTAHKSKGLEFDHVFIIGAVDTSWGEQVRSRSRLIGYPENLPIRPSGDSLDERLRLFFVAMTRARATLSISFASTDQNGRVLLPASFLVNDDWQIIESEATIDTTEIIRELRQEWYRPYVSLDTPTMKQVLASSLEGYRLSVTHLTSFLDVTRGGPDYFLINNLLHFPTSKAPSAQYGSAIHSALQRAHNHLAAHDKRKPVEDVLQDFEKALSQYHLLAQDFQSLSQRGAASLTAFLSAKYDSFNENQKVEMNFANQQSRVGEATLTGALDLVDIDFEQKIITVTDYKTGAASVRWQGKTDGEKLKLHKYRQQLMFYKLLVERSRDFAGYTVNKGTLQFIEPTQSGQIINLDLEFDSDELAEFELLVEQVYRLIFSLELPDISRYPQTYAGTLQFEADIRDGNY